MKRSLALLIWSLVMHGPAFSQFSHTIEEDTDHIRVIVHAQFPMGAGLCPEPFIYTVASADTIHLNVLHVWNGGFAAATCSRTDTIVYYTWAELPCLLVVEQSWIWGESLSMHSIEQTDLCSLDLIEQPAQSMIGIYPNPTSGVLSVSNVRIGQQIEIFDGIGRSIMHIPVMSNPMIIDLDDREGGIYLVRMVEGSRIIGSSRMILSR